MTPLWLASDIHRIGVVEGGRPLMAPLRLLCVQSRGAVGPVAGASMPPRSPISIEP